MFQTTFWLLFSLLKSSQNGAHFSWGIFPIFSALNSFSSPRFDEITIYNTKAWRSVKIKMSRKKDFDLGKSLAKLLGTVIKTRLGDSWIFIGKSDASCEIKFSFLRENLTMRIKRLWVLYLHLYFNQIFWNISLIIQWIKDLEIFIAFTDIKSYWFLIILDCEILEFLKVKLSIDAFLMHFQAWILINLWYEKLSKNPLSIFTKKNKLQSWVALDLNSQIFNWTNFSNSSLFQCLA